MWCGRGLQSHVRYNVVLDVWQHIPGTLHSLCKLSASFFSIRRVVSKIFFSSRTLSIVRSPSLIRPASDGKPASLMNASNVYSWLKVRISFDCLWGLLFSAHFVVLISLEESGHNDGW